MFAANSLRDHIYAWNDINASPTIIDWITNGVKIPFTHKPDPFELNNYNLPKKHHAFIDSEIQSLLESGAIQQCDSKPHCISPINCVPKKGGKLRLVIDLRKLNSHCSTDACQNEGIHTVKELIRPKDKLFSIDLKQGFLHIPVHSDHTTYLGFTWRGRWYKYCSLPFGLCCSNYFFVKCIRPIIAHLRQQGIRITVFIDDFLVMVSANEAQKVKELVLDTLQKLGWCINWEKSQLVPSHSVVFIGYIIDTNGEFPTLCITKSKVNHLKKDIRRALSAPYITARVLARISGSCIAMTKAIVPGKLFLRNIYRLLARRRSWDDTLELDDPASEDLRWWLEALQGWNLQPVVVRPIDVQIQTDASHLGWGAALGDHHAAGYWDKSVALQPSNYREMLAILLALKSFAPMIEHKSVQIQTDNISSVAYVNNMGGPSAQLTDIAKAIWQEAYHLGIHLQATHLAGKLNVLADYLSRIRHPYEWQLHPRLFQYIDETMGPHSIDRFAALHNTQLPVYNARYYDPGAQAVDALAQQDWGDHLNWVNAPFRLIPRVLQIVQNQQAEATIIAPHWPAMPWYRKLVKMAVMPPFRIPNSPRTMWRKGHSYTPEPCKNPKWAIYAWRVSGKMP